MPAPNEASVQGCLVQDRMSRGWNPGFVKDINDWNFYEVEVEVFLIQEAEVFQIQDIGSEVSLLEGRQVSASHIHQFLQPFLQVIFCPQSK